MPTEIEEYKTHLHLYSLDLIKSCQAQVERRLRHNNSSGRNILIKTIATHRWQDRLILNWKIFHSS